jgi:CRISPR-associated protein Cas1
MATAVDTIPPPDYLPARMLNEFVYCPRLFFYEYVEGLFAENHETVEGSLRHTRVDGGRGELMPADWLEESERAVIRSVTVSSARHGLIAKLDVLEVADRKVVPIDYKRGRPRTESDGRLEAWDADRAQMAAQVIALNDNGYSCDEAIVYYSSTKQRVRILATSDLIEWALSQAEAARRVAAAGVLPPPLEDSPKCPRCSLVGICLPDETRLLKESPPAPPADEEPPADAELAVRRLLPARDDLRPLYLNTPGLRVGKRGNVLIIQDRDQVIEEVRISEICQLNLLGGIQLTTQAIQALCENEVPIAYFSQGGWFYGITAGLGARNSMLRRSQFRLADDEGFCLEISRRLIAGKIRNQRTLLQRNHAEPPQQELRRLKQLATDAESTASMASLLGIEGTAARVYFGCFQGMIKVSDGTSQSEASPTPDFRFDFQGRNRRPPLDPVNALLSLAYSVLAKDLTIVCQVVGFDPFIGYFHQPRFGRAPLALDLMEPFRPLIADSTVLTAINTRMIQAADFVRAGKAVALTPSGRKAFFRAYEQRMDTLVTHPIFGYRVSYRRMLEVQTRLLARAVSGEIARYPVFTTR